MEVLVNEATDMSRREIWNHPEYLDHVRKRFQGRQRWMTSRSKRAIRGKDESNTRNALWEGFKYVREPVVPVVGPVIELGRGVHQGYRAREGGRHHLRKHPKSI